MDDRSVSTADLASAPQPVDEEMREASDEKRREAPAEGRPEATYEERPEATYEEPREASGGRGGLIPDEDGASYQERWQEIQVRFVDEPRESVAAADKLVATVIQQLADTFARERGSLEEQWEEGADVSTEDLRVALQRYRLFFERLLAA